MARSRLLVLACLLSFARGASAEGCPEAGRSWVALSVPEGEGSSAEHAEHAGRLFERVRALLQAELERRGVEVCSVEAGAGSKSPSARIELRPISEDLEDASTVEIAIDDALTGKSVSRRLDLSALPIGVRALTIAVGADELLSASWAELSVRRERYVDQNTKQKEHVTPLPRDRRLELGLLGTAELDGSGHPRFGGDWRTLVWLGTPAALFFHLGLRRGLSIHVADGYIQHEQFLVSLGGALPMIEAPAGGVELAAALRYSRTLVHGEAAGAATGSAAAFSTGSAEASILGRLELDPQTRKTTLALVSNLTAGFWFAGGLARDGKRQVQLLRSPSFEVSLGIALEIP